jgi:hypothetical protein
MDYLDCLKEKLEEMEHLVGEALHFIFEIQLENYSDSDDKEKLIKELELILKDLGIEFENE